MLEINDLHASVDGKQILKGIDLKVSPGEVHAIMGPNGSGKSTLSTVVAGHEEFEIDKGVILFEDEDLIDFNTPTAVTCNEAVNLANRYSDEQGRRMINGVLRKLQNSTLVLN